MTLTGKCVVFSNCQGFGLAHFLAKAAFPFELQVFENYKLILKEQTAAALTAAASQCDLFIYQPTREMNHGPDSSEYYIENVIPKTAQTISFAYQYNHAYFPLIGHGDGFLGQAEMDERYWQMPKPALLSAYDAGAIDFALWPRFLACAAEQAKRELHCDIRLSDWIVDNRHQQLFLNFNHPASALFAKLAQEVISIVTDDESPPIPCDHINEANLPCDLPLSRYVIDEFDMRVEPNQFAHGHYRKLLALAWDKASLARQANG